MVKLDIDWYLILRAFTALIVSIWLVRFLLPYRGWSLFYLVFSALSPIILCLSYSLDLLGVIESYLPPARTVAIIIIASPILAIEGVVLNDRI